MGGSIGCHRGKPQMDGWVARPDKPTWLYGKSGKTTPFFMGKSSISMAMFKSYVSLPRVCHGKYHLQMDHNWGYSYFRKLLQMSVELWAHGFVWSISEWVYSLLTWNKNRLPTFVIKVVNRYGESGKWAANVDLVYSNTHSNRKKFATKELLIGICFIDVHVDVQPP